MRLPPSEIRLNWLYDDSGFRIYSGILASRQFVVSLDGLIQTFPQKNIDLQLDLTLKLYPEGLIPFQENGDLTLQGKIYGEPGNPELTGLIHSEEITLNGFQLSGLEIEVRGNRESIEIIRGVTGFCSGKVEFNGLIFQEHNVESWLDIQLKGLRASQCVAGIAQHSPFVGIFDLEAGLKWPGLAIKEYKLTGKTNFSGHLREEDSFEIVSFPLNGQSQFSSSQGILRFSDTHISSDWIDLFCKGNYIPGIQKFNVSGTAEAGNTETIIELLNRLEILSPDQLETYRLQPAGRLVFDFAIQITPSDRIIEAGFNLARTSLNSIQLGFLTGNVFWNQGRIALNQLSWTKQNQLIQTSIAWDKGVTGYQINQAMVSTTRVPLETVAFLFTNEEVTGILSGQFSYEKNTTDSTSSTPRGSGHIRLQNLRWREETVEKLDTDILLEGSRVTVSHLR